MSPDMAVSAFWRSSRRWPLLRNIAGHAAWPGSACYGRSRLRRSALVTPSLLCYGLLDGDPAAALDCDGSHPDVNRADAKRPALRGYCFLGGVSPAGRESLRESLGEHCPVQTRSLAEDGEDISQHVTPWRNRDSGQDSLPRRRCASEVVPRPFDPDSNPLSLACFGFGGVPVKGD